MTTPASTKPAATNLLEVAVGVHDGPSHVIDWQTAVDGVIRSLLEQRRDDDLPARLFVLLATADWCDPARPLSEVLRRSLASTLHYSAPLIGGSMPRIFASLPGPDGPQSHCLEHGFVVITLFSQDVWAAVDAVDAAALATPERREHIKDMAKRLLKSRERHLSLGTSAAADLFAILPGPSVSDDGERQFVDIEIHSEILESFEDVYTLFGGSAADELERPTKGFQFIDDTCLESGLVVALLEHDFKTGALMTHGFQPLDKQVSVDDVASETGEPSYVVTVLDGQPAAARLRALMEEVEFTSPRPTLALGGDQDAQVVVPLERPEFWTAADGSVRMNRKIPRGFRLTVLHATNEELEERAHEALKAARYRTGAAEESIRVVFSFACIGRFVKFEHEEADSWRKAVEKLTQDLVADIPVVCALCAGEYGEDRRRKSRGDNFSLWFSCLSGEPNLRAHARLLQGDLLRGADRLLQMNAVTQVKGEAVRQAIMAGATGGQICQCDPRLRKILGGSHGYGHSRPGSGQDFSAIIGDTWRDLPDSDVTYDLPEELKGWTLQIGKRPTSQNVRPLDDSVDVLTLACANRIAVFIPDSRRPQFHCDLELVKKGGLEAQFVMPLLGAKEEVIGTFQIGFKRGHFMDRERMGLWLGFGQMVGAALERAHEFEERTHTLKINDSASQIAVQTRDSSSDTVLHEDVAELLPLLQALIGSDYLHARVVDVGPTGMTAYRLVAPNTDLGRAHVQHRPFVSAHEGSMRYAIARGTLFTSEETKTAELYEPAADSADAGNWDVAIRNFKTVGNVLLGTPEKPLGCLVFHSHNNYFFTERRQRLVAHIKRAIEGIVARREAQRAKWQAEQREQMLIRFGLLGGKTVHDLIRPLSNMQKFLELLELDVAGQYVPDLKKIFSQCEMLIELLKSRAQGIELGFVVHTPEDLMREVRTEMVVPWDGQPVFVPPVQDTPVHSNFWLRSAIASLLDNAVEHDPEAPPRQVEVLVRHPGPAPNRVHIVIENDGPEFTQEEVDAFRRPGHSSKPGHLGVGVPLAEAGVRTAGGELMLMPRQGGGVVAIVDLPVHGAVHSHLS